MPKTLLAAGYFVVLAAVLGLAQPDMERGKEAFQKRCTGCHALDTFKAGPPLRNVYGRRAGSSSNFPYSEALKNSKLTWKEDNLNQWLTDPDSLVPDTDMSFRLDNAAERAAIVNYLKQLASRPEGTQ